MSKETSGKNPLGNFLLGFLCASALALLVRMDSPRIAHADSASSGAIGEYICVTGSDNTGLGMVYVLNAKEKKLAAYQWDRNFLYFLAQRDLQYDFQIDDWNNRSKAPISSENIKDEIEKIQAAKEKRKPK